jgi:two-component system sensor histidine kinase TctE
MMRMKLPALLRPTGSLRRSLVGRLVVALLLIGVAGAVFTSFLVDRSANLAYDRGLADDISMLASELELKGGRLRINLPPVARDWLLSNEGERMLYRVMDLDTGEVLESNIDFGPWFRGEKEPGSIVFENMRLDDTDFRVASLERHLPGSAVTALLQVGETLGQRRRVVREIMLGSMLVFGLMILAAATVVWRGTRNALQPLELLEAQAAQRSSTDLRPLDPLLAPVEVRRLVVAINHLMNRLSQSMQSQSRFIANAAHQLRTPLAGLRLQAQLGMDEAADVRMRTRLGDIDRSARRAGHLIEQLLTLARAEAGGAQPPSEPVDLVTAARDVLERHLGFASSRGIDLGYAGQTDAVMVPGNGILLREMLSNLVDNALRYGRAGGVVTIGLNVEDSMVTVSVTDDGRGMPMAISGNLFSRFSQSDSTNDGGAGLGLAIVKEIADLHTAEVQYRPAKPQGTEVAVTFPLGAISAA